MLGGVFLQCSNARRLFDAKSAKYLFKPGVLTVSVIFSDSWIMNTHYRLSSISIFSIFMWEMFRLGQKFLYGSTKT